MQEYYTGGDGSDSITIRCGYFEAQIEFEAKVLIENGKIGWEFYPRYIWVSQICFDMSQSSIKSNLIGQYDKDRDDFNKVLNLFLETDVAGVHEFFMNENKEKLKQILA